jgi:hypothetical protein
MNIQSTVMSHAVCHSLRGYTGHVSLGEGSNGLLLLRENGH